MSASGRICAQHSIYNAFICVIPLGHQIAWDVVD